MESLINSIIKEYSPQLWLGFVSLVATSFIMILIKDFIADLVNYFTARMSDIGFGQPIYYQGELYRVREIRFRYIIIYDNEKVIRIPLRNYLKGPIAYPNPKDD